MWTYVQDPPTTGPMAVIIGVLCILVSLIIWALPQKESGGMPALGVMAGISLVLTGSMILDIESTGIPTDKTMHLLVSLCIPLLLTIALLNGVWLYVAATVGVPPISRALSAIMLTVSVVVCADFARHYYPNETWLVWATAIGWLALGLALCYAVLTVLLSKKRTQE